MGSDWIDNVLQQAEGIPFLGGVAHDLRLAYDIWREDPPDPQPVQQQINNLDGYHNKASQLLSNFNESLLTLRQSWTGNDADFYFGPQVTAFQIEHDMEPTTTGAGYQMWQRLNQLTYTLDYNRAAHQKAHDTLTQIQDLHGQLQAQVWEAAGLLVADVAEAAIPGAEELDIATVPVTAEKVGEATSLASKIVQIARAFLSMDVVIMGVKFTVGQLLAIAFVIGSIVGIPLVTFLVLSNSNNNASPPTASAEQVKEISKRLSDAGVKGFTRKEIEQLLREGYTPDEIVAMLTARYLLQQGGIPVSLDTLKELAKKGLTPEEMVNVVLAGLDPSLSAEQLRAQLADLDSRISGRENFSLQELRIAYYLSSKGYYVTYQPTSQTSRTADFLVQLKDANGNVIQQFTLEGKTLQPGTTVTPNTVGKAIEHAISGEGQSENVFIDGRDTNLTEEQAIEGVKGKLGDLVRHGTQWVRIVGDGFDITVEINPGPPASITVVNNP